MVHSATWAVALLPEPGVDALGVKGVIAALQRLERLVETAMLHRIQANGTLVVILLSSRSSSRGRRCTVAALYHADYCVDFEMGQSSSVSGLDFREVLDDVFRRQVGQDLLHLRH